MSFRDEEQYREYMREYMRDRRKKQRRDGKPEPWSADEIDRLREVVGRIGPVWKRVAQEMPDRSPDSCKWAYNADERRRRLAEVTPSTESSPKRLKSWQDKRAKERAAEEERARVMALQRSAVEELLGDPLPGRSALDKKRAGIVDPEYFDRRTVLVPKKPTLYTGERA